MREFINANETIRENDHETVASAIRLAIVEGCRKVVIPRYNARTKEMKWLFGEAVLLPSHFKLILDNCQIGREAGFYGYLVTNEHSGSDSGDPAYEDEDIAVLGEGNVILNAEVSGCHSAEADRRNSSEPARNGPVFFWKRVNGLRVENLHIAGRRGQTLSHVMTRNAVIRNIDFCETRFSPDFNGIEVLKGCGRFFIENVSFESGELLYPVGRTETLSAADREA